MQGEVWRDVLDMTTADAGGMFAYIPGIRSADAESFDKAQTIVRQTTARTHRR